MSIYVLIIEDRHSDTEARLFSTPEKAIAAAHDYLKEFDASTVDIEDASMSVEDLALAGWLFYACYSTEGDCVRVLRAEIDT